MPSIDQFYGRKLVEESDSFFIQLLSDRETKSYTENQLSYWRGVWGLQNPPELLVLATSSLRKGYLAWLESIGFDFSQIPQFLEDNNIKSSLIGKTTDNFDPISFQHIVEKNIFNGDGFLKPGTILVLGTFHGVPVIVDPQTGEDHGNENPTQQSKNKINSLKEASRYSNLNNVVFIASDTVGNTNGKNGQSEALGKPRNHPQFPKESESLNGNELENRLRLFPAWYLLQYFTSIPVTDDFEQWYLSDGSSLAQVQEWLINTYQDEENPVTEQHRNSLVALVGDKFVELETVLEYSLTKQEQIWLAWQIVCDLTQFEKVQDYFSESAGAGLFQTRFPLDRKVRHDDAGDVDELVKSISDQTFREYLLTQDPELRPWLVLLHIMGVPVWAHAILGGIYKKSLPDLSTEK